MIDKIFLKRIGIFTMSILICASCIVQPAYANNKYNNGNNGNNGNNKYKNSYSSDINAFLQGVGNALNSAGQFINNGVDEVNKIIYGKKEESNSNSTSNATTNEGNNQSNIIDNNTTSDNSESLIVTYENIPSSNMDNSTTYSEEESVDVKSSDSEASVVTEKKETEQKKESVPLDLSKVVTTAETDVTADNGVEDDTVFMGEDSENATVLTGTASTSSSVTGNETELLGGNQEQSDRIKYVLGGFVIALAVTLIYYFIRKSREGKMVILTNSMTAQRIATDTTDDKSVIEVKTDNLKLAEQMRKDVSSEIKSIKESLKKQDDTAESRKMDTKKSLKKKDKLYQKEKSQLSKAKKKQVKAKKINSKNFDDFEIEVC